MSPAKQIDWPPGSYKREAGASSPSSWRLALCLKIGTYFTGTGFFFSSFTASFFWSAFGASIGMHDLARSSTCNPQLPFAAAPRVGTHDGKHNPVPSVSAPYTGATRNAHKHARGKRAIGTPKPRSCEPATLSHAPQPRFDGNRHRPYAPLRTTTRYTAERAAPSYASAQAVKQVRERGRPPLTLHRTPCNSRWIRGPAGARSADCCAASAIPDTPKGRMDARYGAVR